MKRKLSALKLVIHMLQSVYMLSLIWVNFTFVVPSQGIEVDKQLLAFHLDIGSDYMQTLAFFGFVSLRI